MSPDRPSRTVFPVPVTYKADAHRKHNEETTSTRWASIHTTLVYGYHRDTQLRFGILRIYTLRGKVPGQRATQLASE